MKNSREMFEDYYRPHFGITEQWNERGPRGTYNNESLQSMFEGFHAAYQALQSELEKVKAELKALHSFNRFGSNDVGTLQSELASTKQELEKVKAELAYYKNGTRIKEVHYDEHLAFELAAEKAKSEKMAEALESIAAPHLGEHLESYFDGIAKEDIIECCATDTRLARETLAAYKGDEK